MSSYARLERERPSSVRDHTAVWNRLTPIGSAGAAERAVIEQFCEGKRITSAALEALGARVHRHHDKGLCLAYAGRSPATGHVVAIKYRPINGSSHDSFAEPPSTWLLPIIVGRRESLDWLLAEGETDAAWLYDLVGDECAILVLPAGARTFKPQWADAIPRGARVFSCHDADEDGDAGARKAADIIGERTFRVRPPVEGGDWCDWNGDREAFLKLARQEREKMQVASVEDFAGSDEPGAAALLGEGEDGALIPEGGDVMFYGDGGAGKTTLAVDLSLHLGAGESWLGIAVQRPVNVLLIENEGPRPMFRRKLRRKLAAWTGAPVRGRIYVFERPWGEFTFAAERWRAELAEVVADHDIDLVVAGPLTRIGMEGPGTLHEVAAFMGLVRNVRNTLDRPLAVILIHHENKAGAVSGAWEGSGDTLLHVQGAGNGHTVVFIQKARWDRERHQATLKLAWTEGEGYELEGDRDLPAEVEGWLDEHGWSTAAEIGASKTAEEPGVGANQKAIRDLLEGNPERFESRTGDDARALGRSPRAMLWNLIGAADSVDSVALFTESLGTARKRTESLNRPLKGDSVRDESVPHAPTGSDRNGIGDADLVSGVPADWDCDEERAERLADRWRDALEHDGRETAREGHA